MTRYARFATPLGTMFSVAIENRITRLDFVDAKYARPIPETWQEAPDAAPLKECIAQVHDYFAGRRRDFDLPLDPAGTDFQQRVWNQIAGVPFGKTITY